MAEHQDRSIPSSLTSRPSPLSALFISCFIRLSYSCSPCAPAIEPSRSSFSFTGSLFVRALKRSQAPLRMFLLAVSDRADHHTIPLSCTYSINSNCFPCLHGNGRLDQQNARADFGLPRSTPPDPQTLFPCKHLTFSCKQGPSECEDSKTQ